MVHFQGPQVLVNVSEPIASVFFPGRLELSGLGKEQRWLPGKIDPSRSRGDKGESGCLQLPKA